MFRWLGGSVVKALDSGPRGREFNSRPVCYQVTTLGKLFTPTCLCRCTWSSGWCRLVTFRLRFDSHRGSFASNLGQVANLLCVQVNSASYPQRDGKWVVAYGLWGEGLVWLFGAVVCLLAANCGSSCSLMRAMDGRIVRCGIISSCQSAATSEIVKRFWSRTHVRSVITSIATFAFTFLTVWSNVASPCDQVGQHCTWLLVEASCHAVTRCWVKVPRLRYTTWYPRPHLYISPVSATCKSKLIL